MIEATSSDTAASLGRRFRIPFAISVLVFAIALSGCHRTLSSRSYDELEELANHCDQRRIEVDGRTMKPRKLQVRFVRESGGRSVWASLCRDVDLTGDRVVIDGRRPVEHEAAEIAHGELRKNQTAMAVGVTTAAVLAVPAIIVGVFAAFVLGSGHGGGGF